MKRVVITKVFFDICHMQVCVVADATDAEILARCNTKNPCGTSMGWVTVVRASSEALPDSAPIACADDAGRLHILVGC